MARRLPPTIRVKKKEERGGGEEEITGISRPKDYSSDPLSSKLVMIDVIIIESYEGIVVERGDRRSIYQRQSS